MTHAATAQVVPPVGSTPVAALPSDISARASDALVSQAEAALAAVEAMLSQEAELRSALASLEQSLRDKVAEFAALARPPAPAVDQQPLDIAGVQAVLDAWQARRTLAAHSPHTRRTLAAHSPHTRRTLAARQDELAVAADHAKTIAALTRWDQQVSEIIDGLSSCLTLWSQSTALRAIEEQSELERRMLEREIASRIAASRRYPARCTGAARRR